MIDEYRQMRAFWAEVIDQCISSKPVNDNAAALLDYLKRSEFTVEQLHAIILGALTEDESNDEGEQDEDDIEDYDDEITRCQECDRWIEDDELVCPHCGAVQISRDSDE